MFKHIYSVIFFFIFITGPISSEEKIVFIDIDKVIYQSELGKKLNKKITDEIKKEDTKLRKKEKELQNKENDILKQKNILSQEELNVKITKLKKEINKDIHNLLIDIQIGDYIYKEKIIPNCYQMPPKPTKVSNVSQKCGYFYFSKDKVVFIDKKYEDNKGQDNTQ